MGFKKTHLKVSNYVKNINTDIVSVDNHIKRI